MLSILLQKIKKVKYWIIGLLIPVALAAPLFFGEIKQNTYRASWRVSFQNLEEMQRVTSNHPKEFPNFQIIPLDENYVPPRVLVLVWKDFNAATTTDVIPLIDFSVRDIASIKMLDSNNKWITKHATSSIPRKN